MEDHTYRDKSDALIICRIFNENLKPRFSAV